MTYLSLGLLTYIPLVIENIAAKYTPKNKIRIDKNTTIYCQKHSHCTFASSKNAMYPI